MSTRIQHNVLTGNNLHYSKFQEVSGPPMFTPTYVGQTIWDTLNRVLYVSKGTSSLSDWQSSQGIVNVVSGTTYTVLGSDNGNVVRLTNTGVRTVTLITTPFDSFVVTIEDGSINAFTNNITVNRGGSDIFDGGATSLVLRSDSISRTLVYTASTSTWITI